MRYVRRLSPTERYYISGDSYRSHVDTPCINQMVIEGSGIFDRSAWEQAVALASGSNPGSRLRLIGKTGFSHWRACPDPVAITYIDQTEWDGYCDQTCPFELSPLPIRSGPTSEVILMQAPEKSFVVIRTHHGCMDGRGTLSFAEDIFRALNAQNPYSEDPALTVLDVFRAAGERQYQPRYFKDMRSPTGAPDGSDEQTHWLRKTLYGNFNRVLAKVLHAISNNAARFQHTPARVLIPVDMRDHLGVRTTANLTGAIVSEISENMTPEDISKQIKTKLANKEETHLPPATRILPTELLNWIPLRVLKQSSKKQLTANIKVDGFHNNAIVSNLGKIPISGYQGGGFSASSCFFIPPRFMIAPVFITVSGGNEHLELVMRIRKCFATNGRDEALLQAISEAIESH